MIFRGKFTQSRNSAASADGDGAPVHIEVGYDWMRCDGREGCGALLPITQSSSCPLCGRVNRQDIMPLAQRRLVPGHDAYDHAVTVLRPERAAIPPETGRPHVAAMTAASPSEPIFDLLSDSPGYATTRLPGEANLRSHHIARSAPGPIGSIAPRPLPDPSDRSLRAPSRTHQIDRSAPEPMGPLGTLDERGRRPR
jgi:hypothetical protein